MSLPNFSDSVLLRRAFVHRSYLNEHRVEKESNERLEFLGDAVLSFVVSSWLFETMPERPEGELTNLRSKLVNTRSLARVSKKLGLGEKLLLSRGEEDGGGRENESLLADTFEALVGALYLDQGMPAVKEFISASLLTDTEDLTENLKDPKSLLQEVVQGKKLPSPAYRVVSEEGPDHNKMFTVAVDIGGKEVASGSGRSKREAETVAAGSALSKWK